MPPRKPDMYVCVEAFVTTDGISVSQGDLVDAGHPIMKNRDWAFAPFAGPRFVVEKPKAEEKRDKPIEQATAAPGEKRGATK